MAGECLTEFAGRFGRGEHDFGKCHTVLNAEVQNLVLAQHLGGALLLAGNDEIRQAQTLKRSRAANQLFDRNRNPGLQALGRGFRGGL